MKNKITPLILLIMLTVSLTAQEQVWFKTLLNRTPTAVCTHNNMIIVGGDQDYPGQGNIAQGFVTLYDSDGQIIWDKVFGSPMSDKINRIACDDNNIYLTGTTWAKNKGNQLWFAKLDMQGNLIFNKNFGGKYDDFGNALITTSDKNILIAGATKQNDNDLLNLWVIKADTNGNIIWEKNYGSYDHGEQGINIKELDNGYLIISKKWNKKGLSDFDTWIVFLDKNNGNLLWTRELADIEDNIIKDAVFLPNNALMFIGHNDNKLKTHNSDLWIVIMNDHGNTMVSKTVGSKMQERGLRIFKYNGKYLIAGNIDEKASIWYTDANANTEKPIWGLADKMYDAALKDNKLIIVGGNKPGYVKVIEISQ